MPPKWFIHFATIMKAVWMNLWLLGTSKLLFMNFEFCFPSFFLCLFIKKQDWRYSDPKACIGQKTIHAVQIV